VIDPYTPVRFDDPFIVGMAEVAALAERDVFRAYDAGTAH
jgi:hypothetical protein